MWLPWIIEDSSIADVYHREHHQTATWPGMHQSSPYTRAPALLVVLMLFALVSQLTGLSPYRGIDPSRFLLVADVRE